MNTIDNAHYTCHIQGLFVFAQTDSEATTIAYNNLNNSASDSDLLYPDDLFRIHVRSEYVSPAMPYIQRTHGFGSVFTSYTVIAVNFTFIISNNRGKFGTFFQRNNK